MNGNTIYSDEYVRIFSSSSDVFIETFRKGFSVEKLNGILSSHPEIGVTSFTAIKSSIGQAPRPPVKFGEIKEKIIVNIINDGLQATVTYNLPKEELDLKKRDKLIKATYAKLEAAGVVFGVKKQVLTGELVCGKTYVIAEGIPAVDGRDSIIRLYELEDARPAVQENGKVDFYDLKLINKVKVGDWLGERIEATDGIPGKNVKGNAIKPVKGKNFPLIYDRNTVQEVFDNNKTTLYARIDGAVNYSNGRLNVSNHLEIDGDVDLSTGNIRFDGYVTVKGTVVDGFSVEATKDIEVNGMLGLGNIKGITSTSGSIFIRGGLSPKSRVEIKAAKNVFIKFLDNSIINCGGTVHIGYYCINSYINAREVIIDSINGQIFGGRINAEVRVVAPTIGSEIERRTVIEVTGFKRRELVESLERIVKQINDLRNEQQKLKQVLSHLDEQGSLNLVQRKEYNDGIERIFNIKEEIKSLEEERKNITGYLKARGDGEISATKRIYPNCSLILMKNIIEIPSLSFAATYYIQDGEIRQV